ncbi:MAG TPA: hybrid sensor histidine kinase/response regulator [Candidatus Limnocylindria bacterium]|nr:hybrid sensor histidine kinase/response regulator [Candidatus Limnocylindria bacterium]
MSRPQHVLNVDDNSAGRYSRTRTLREAGFRVTEAGTGTEALSAAASLPDVVLLDINLPDIDGFEVCRRIRTDPLTSRLPVVHVSASRVAATDRAQGLEGGADAYLAEPVEPLELIAVVRAVMRTRRAEEAAIEARREAEEALAERDRFIAVAAHELKGPLTALRARVQLARTSLATGRGAAAHLERAMGAVDALTQLIDQLWDRSALASEGAAPAEPIDIVPVARAVIASVEELAASHGCAVDVDAVPSARVAIRGARLQAVIRNLLTNAIKYGRGRPVHVRIEVSGDSARLSVADEGPGIAEADRERVFAPYVRLTHDEPGLGLGLAIVRDIVEAAGGRVDVAIAPGHGATFVVELPLAA